MISFGCIEFSPAEGDKNTCAELEYYFEANSFFMDQGP